MVTLLTAGKEVMAADTGRKTFIWLILSKKIHPMHITQNFDHSCHSGMFNFMTISSKMTTKNITLQT